MQFHEVFEDFLAIAVPFLFLFDFAHGGGGCIALLAAEVGLIVIDLHLGLDLLFEVAAVAVLDGVELLLADGFDPGGLRLGAQAEVVRVVGLVVAELDQAQDFYLLLCLPVLAFVLSLCHLRLQQSLLHPHQFQPEILVLLLQVLD